MLSLLVVAVLILPPATYFNFIICVCVCVCVCVCCRLMSHSEDRNVASRYSHGVIAAAWAMSPRSVVF